MLDNDVATIAASCAILEEIRPRDAVAAQMRYGLPPYGRPYTYTEIALMLGISRGRVYQLLARVNRHARALRCQEN